MQNIEKFIREHRTEFDSKEPSSALWAKIEGCLDTPKASIWSWWRGMGIAASVAILLCLGYMAGRYGRPIADNSDIMTISATYGTDVVKYASYIDDRREQLENHGKTNPELVNQFEMDLQELNKSYLSLKATLPNNPNQEVILIEMIKNLKWQVELLDQQLQLLRDLNKKDQKVITELNTIQIPNLI